MTPGTKLGPYEIVCSLGKGGMGEVWRARDPRLNREVAIKVSALQFTDRFEREAHAIASLNHPNICTLFDIGPNYLVMELVEGPTLAERIAEGPVPLDEALGIAKQIADALEAAHEKGIVHRDLKPANIKIRPDGSVKVLDFGLATAGGAGAVEVGPDSPTMMAPSVAGMILGTAGYMAPEQARGKTVDKRADIWAFGVVVYEMVTGEKLFEGETVSDTLASVIRAEPDFTRVPVRLQRLLRRCLEKDPAKRLRDITGVEFLLEDGAIAPSRSRRSIGGRIGAGAWILAGALGLALAALAFVHFREKPTEVPVIVSSIPIPENVVPGYVALSPDGRWLATALFSGIETQLYVRSLDSPDMRPLANTVNARGPFWSPDSKWIGFFADGKLKTIAAGGGPAQSLCDGTGLGLGGSWGSDGNILLSTSGGRILRVNASGGACTPVIKSEPDTRHDGSPQLLSDGRHFLYYSGNTDESKAGEYLASLDDPNGHRLLADLSSVIYAAPQPGGRYGQLLFLREARLMVQPFDERTLQLVGDPVAVAEDASMSFTGFTPAASTSATGILAYVANQSRDAQLMWFDQTGKELGKVGTRNQQNAVALSPDGNSVAISIGPGGVSSVWLRNLARDSESRLSERGSSPVWSPDSGRIVYARTNDLYLRDASGGGAEALLFRSANSKRASDWSHDGRYLLYTEIDPKTQGDIWYLEDPLGKAGGRAVRFLATNATESQAQFSPDGTRVAYASDESGKFEVYIRPFPSGPGQWKVSVNGGREPRWSADGKELYYIEPARVNIMMAASVRSGREGASDIGVPQRLFEFRNIGVVPQQNTFTYSVATGGRFLVNVSADTGPPTVNLIYNWQKLAGVEKEKR